MKNDKAPIPTELFAYAISAKRYALFNISNRNAPIIRKASQHGLGHLLPPYGENDSAPRIPNPCKPLYKLRLARWHYDFWWKIIDAALAGTTDQVPLDYHPALAKPALGRYGATSPEMLKWFQRWNEPRPYQAQVRPFGFLAVLFGRNGSWASYANVPIDDAPGRGRPHKRPDISPVAPFERDPDMAAAQAFDRVTGELVEVAALKTYAEAIANYPTSAENKFRNGGGADHGTTKQRHVKATSVRLIGKEGNKVEEDGSDLVGKSQFEVKSTSGING